MRCTFIESTQASNTGFSGSIIAAEDAGCLGIARDLDKSTLSLRALRGSSSLGTRFSYTPRFSMLSTPELLTTLTYPPEQP